jgi:HD-GYP domain-containing protein (c-di-GMP phosphodiesterase class II)
MSILPGLKRNRDIAENIYTNCVRRIYDMSAGAGAAGSRILLNMVKKVKVQQLKPEMYIHDLNCGWLKHPFVTNSFKIKDEEVIEKIISHGIRSVYIDTVKGADVDGAPTEHEVRHEIQQELNDVADKKPEKQNRVSLKEELVKAKEIKKEAKETVQNILDDVRLGKQIETEKVECLVDKMLESILRNPDALISLSRLREVDEYTYVHSMAVCTLMISFGSHLDYEPQILRDVGIGAMLHDIGKMRVPQEILTKRNGLSDDEYRQIKEHVVFSRNILEETKGISQTSILLASQHHERVDGTGYPQGLEGRQTSEFGQAAAIADVYDAMTSKRCYQRKYEPTEVLKKLFEWSENQYNKNLVQHFIRNVGIYPIGVLVRMQSGLLGVVLNHGEKNLLHPVVRVVYDTNKDRALIPYDVDLSLSEADRVACHEVPDRWRIYPERYM